VSDVKRKASSVSSVTRGRAGFLGGAGIAIAGGLVAAATLRQPNSVAPDTTSADQPERELVTA
jgi:hypothetical protein